MGKVQLPMCLPLPPCDREGAEDWELRIEI
jgi:hypothetical protein